MSTNRSGLSADTQALMLFESSKKSTGVAYLLWFFTGGVGGHRFYMGRTKSAIGMIALTILGWATLVAVVGGFLLAALGIWLIVDAFTMPGWIAEHNNALMARLNKAAGPSGSDDVADQLAKFADLKEKGAITEEEFETQKKRIMEQLSPSIVTGH
jgi:TM2 domain-containing membrane protein YozV